MEPQPRRRNVGSVDGASLRVSEGGGGTSLQPGGQNLAATSEHPFFENAAARDATIDISVGPSGEEGQLAKQDWWGTWSVYLKALATLAIGNVRVY